MNAIMSGSKIIRLLIIAVCASVMFQPFANAGMISNDQLVTQEQTASKKAELVNLLNSEEVRTQMTEMGVDLADAEDRVASMTDAELDQVFAGLDTLAVGSGIAGTILTVLLIILILDIAGVTDIFPGV